MTHEVNQQLLGQTLQEIGKLTEDGVKPPTFALTSVPAETAIPHETVLRLFEENDWDTIVKATRATLDLRQKARKTGNPHDVALWRAVLEHAQRLYPLDQIVKQ